MNPTETTSAKTPTPAISVPTTTRSTSVTMIFCSSARLRWRKLRYGSCRYFASNRTHKDCVRVKQKRYLNQASNAENELLTTSAPNESRPSATLKWL